MRKLLKNSQMVVMLRQLEPILSHRDKIGYVAARNYRTLSEALTEYDKFRGELIEKYGTSTENEDGVTNTSIKVGTPEFKSFCDEMAPFNEIEHEVEIMMAKFEEVVGCLSGEEILLVDWMLED